MKKQLTILCVLLCTGAFAQNFSDVVKEQLIKEWVRAKAYTNEYLAAMPADKYSFKPNDSIRTFAQQMLHLAQGNIGLMGNAVAGEKPAFAMRNLEKAAGAQSKDSVTYFVNQSYDYAINGLKQFDASKFEEKASWMKLDETKLAWILKAFEHQTHHRGQTTIYLRTAGIHPPQEKLF